MRRLLQPLLPPRVYENINTALLVVAALVLAYGFFRLEQTSTEANRVSRKANALAADTRRLTQENQRRIAEIQASRLASCRQTYQAFHDLFAPFVNQPGQTAKQRADTVRFFKLVQERKRACVKQVTPPPISGKTNP